MHIHNYHTNRNNENVVMISWNTLMAVVHDILYLDHP